MRVLIVEDDRTAADFLAKALGEAGYQTEIAGDGEAGFALASTQSFGVLIVDRMLPKLDGLTLVERLRARGDRTPVLILSALGGVESLAFGSDGRRLAREMSSETGREFDDAEAVAVDNLSGAIFDELNATPQPHSGATALLSALELSYVTFAIATSSLPGQVMASVTSLALPSEPTIVDGSHVEHAKPAPDLLLYAAAQLKATPERCWYVGDSTWDMVASAAAGMIGIGVTTGAADAGALLAAGAAVTIEDLTVLLAELRRRGLPT